LALLAPRPAPALAGDLSAAGEAVFVVGDDARVVTGDHVAVGLAVVVTRLHLAQNAAVVEDLRQIAHGPLVGAERLNALARERPDDACLAVIVRRELKDALERGDTFGDRLHLAVDHLQPRGQSFGHDLLLFPGALAAFPPRALDPIRLLLALLIGKLNEHGER